MKIYRHTKILLTLETQTRLTVNEMSNQQSHVIERKHTHVITHLSLFLNMLENNNRKTVPTHLLLYPYVQIKTK